MEKVRWFTQREAGMGSSSGSEFDKRNPNSNRCKFFQNINLVVNCEKSTAHNQSHRSVVSGRVSNELARQFVDLGSFPWIRRLGAESCAGSRFFRVGRSLLPEESVGRCSAAPKKLGWMAHLYKVGDGQSAKHPAERQQGKG
jgi:hypothetical protein